MEYKIEKGIPITSKRLSGKILKYPFKDMEVGDSFMVGEYSRVNISTILSKARYWSKMNKNSYKFSARKTQDNQIRIWRIE